MHNLINKEFKLSAHILSYIFISFGLMTFLPGYPILVGAFFSSLGIFQSFQSYRESNDINYSILLPVTKKDIVKAKYIFVMVIQGLTFLLMCIITFIRMIFLKDVDLYVNNALITANFVFLGYALVVFGLFNFVFVKGFFKTGYYFGKPFILFCILAFLIIGIAETLRYIPHLENLNTFGFEHMDLQLSCFGMGLLIYVSFTYFGIKKSINTFEKIDL